MKEQSFESFSKNLQRTNQRKPLYGQIELTYNCRYSCRHCYCKNQPRNDLGAGFWKKILDQLKSQGCFEITFTGGDPLLHKEFLSIYDYAIKNGFLVTIFTSGYPLTDELISFLSDQPPVSIEITVNSLNKLTYEKITGFKGGFDKTFSNIYKLKERGLPLILKCNGLRQNKNEIYQIKKFAEELLGKGKFKYDSFIFPGLNGEKAPLDCRLKPEEIKEIEQNDEDMLRQRRDQLKLKGHWFNPKGLYHCNSWLSRFYINPQGLLQFCHLTKDFSADLKSEPFKAGFDRFIEVLAVKPANESKCLGCELLHYCYRCPARAFLETGDPEAPVEYYCELARLTKDFEDEWESQLESEC